MNSPLRGLLGLFLILVFCGIAALVVGYDLYKQGTGTQAEPQQITCRQLQEEGFGDNAHVVVTHFLFSNEYIYEESSSGGRWTKVWIPIVPEDAPDANTFRVVLRSTRHHDMAELNELYEQLEVQGIVSLTHKLGGEERKLLKEGHPHVNLDNVLVLDLGKQHWPPAYGIALAGLGGVVILAAVGIAVSRIAQARRESHPPAVEQTDRFGPPE